MTRSCSVSIQNTGVYSNDGLFRYSLTRCWSLDLKKLLFVMHNPSKAREVLNDDTVMACQNIAWLIGERTHLDRVSNDLVDQLPHFGAIRVCNLYPVFAASPKDVKDPGPAVLSENDHEIKRSCRWADWVVCAWGKPKSVSRGCYVEGLIRVEPPKVLCFGLTRAGRYPMHPGRVKRLKKTKFPCHLQDCDGSISTERRLLHRLQPWN